MYGDMVFRGRGLAAEKERVVPTYWGLHVVYGVSIVALVVYRATMTKHRHRVTCARHN
jgi:hypothetical protein